VNAKAIVVGGEAMVERCSILLYFDGGRGLQWDVRWILGKF
jgi:hypothetical protein